MTSKSNSSGGLHPSRVPAYTPAEAAHWIGVPASTVRAWVLGRPGRDARANRSSKGARSVIDVADRAAGLLSFQNLVEVHVLAAIRRRHGVTLQNVRRALGFMEDSLGIEHPLAHREMLTDGKDLFVEEFGKLLNASDRGQLEMREVLDAYLQRVVHERSGLPIQLYPFTTPNLALTRRAVSIDPRVHFGRPCVSETGVPTAALAERYSAGESMDSIARDHGLKRAQVEDAVRYELGRVA